jgi:hypothetical protein
MVKRIVTTTEYTDDLDGSPAAGTVTFGFNGQQYEIDLSRSNAKAFEKAMALYVGHARKVRHSRTRASSRRGNGSRDVSAVREWATANGYEVSYQSAN